MNTSASRLAVGAAAILIGALTCLPPVAADTYTPQSPVSQLAETLNPMNWKMPEWKMPSFRNLMPGNDEQARIKKKKDGLVQEVTKTASSSWQKTKSALNPRNFTPKFSPASARTPVKKTTETKPGFFRSLFGADNSESEDDITVTDFLGQSRPSR